MDSITITLAKPIPSKGKEITALVLREPLIRDYIKAERQGVSSPTAVDAALIAEVAGVSFADFTNMPISEFRRVLHEVRNAGFFGDPGPGPIASEETS